MHETIASRTRGHTVSKKGVEHSQQSYSESSVKLSYPIYVTIYKHGSEHPSNKHTYQQNQVQVSLGGYLALKQRLLSNPYAKSNATNPTQNDRRITSSSVRCVCSCKISTNEKVCTRMYLHRHDPQTQGSASASSSSLSRLRKAGG